MNKVKKKLINENQKIFVAGHKGMVGSAIKRKLNHFGYNNLMQFVDYLESLQEFSMGI